MEEYAWVLDYMPNGHPDSKRFKREPLVLAIGEMEFKLLELVPKEDPNITHPSSTNISYLNNTHTTTLKPKPTPINHALILPSLVINHPYTT